MIHNKSKSLKFIDIYMSSEKINNNVSTKNEEHLSEAISRYAFLPVYISFEKLLIN